MTTPRQLLGVTGRADRTVAVDIEAWLQELGLERYAQAFRENAIGLDVLPQLTNEHLKDLGLPLGDRLRLLKAVAVLAGPAEPRPAAELKPEAASVRGKLA